MRGGDSIDFYPFVTHYAIILLVRDQGPGNTYQEALPLSVQLLNVAEYLACS